MGHQHFTMSHKKSWETYALWMRNIHLIPPERWNRQLRFWHKYYIPNPEGKKAMAINMQEIRFPEAFKKSTGAKKEVQQHVFLLMSLHSLPFLNINPGHKWPPTNQKLQENMACLKAPTSCFLKLANFSSIAICRDWWLTCWHQHVRNIWIRLTSRQPKRGGRGCHGLQHCMIFDKKRITLNDPFFWWRVEPEKS